MADFFDKLSGIQNKWHTWVGLAAAEAIVPPIALFFKQFETPNLYILLICIVAAISILLIWYFSNLLPKTKAGKIGFVVSISCEDDVSHNRIRDDFVLTLKKLLSTGKAGRYFQFIEIPKHISVNVVDVDDAHKIKIKTNAHFVLYGRSRKRPINSINHDYIELDGIVAHNPIPKSVNEQLALEFSELLPRKIAINNENGLFAFEFTSEWTELVAKYIIGIAAEVSGDLICAEDLFNEVSARLIHANKSIPIYAKLKERIPVRLAEISEARSIKLYNTWIETHDDVLIDGIVDEISKIDSRVSLVSSIHHKAIVAFIRDRDVDKAIKMLKSCSKSDRNSLWHINLAFLEAYKGDLRKSLQHYRNAEKLNVDLDTLNQIESFITYVISIEPDKYQLYFCLGYINWKIKGDVISAINDYKKFVDLAIDDAFSEQAVFATKWISELESAEIK